jgi:hypothetical protein
MADVMIKNIKLMVPDDLSAWLASTARAIDRPVAYVARQSLERARRGAESLGDPVKAEIRDAAETWIEALWAALPPDRALAVAQAELARLDGLLANLREAA